MAHVPPQVPCPYCGNRNVRAVIPKSELVKKVQVKGEVSGAGSAEGSVEMWQNPYPRSHSYCSSCDKSYSWTSMTPDYLLQNARSSNESKSERIAELIGFFYPGTGMTLTSLISNHCVGIVRPYRTQIPYITNNFLRKKFHACFHTNAQRTYLVLTKSNMIDNGNKFEYLEVESLVMSI